MSRYFASLLERTLRPAPAVEPRPYTRFEPAPAAAGVQDVPDVMAEHERRAPEAHFVGQRRDGEQPLSVPGAAPAQPEAFFPPSGHEPDARPRQASPARRGDVPRGPVAPPARAVSPGAPVWPADGVTAASVAAAEGHFSELPRVKDRREAVTPGAPSLAPVGRLRDEPSRRDEPPVVRVTIGRVDVRATFAAPPPAPRPPAERKPGLSLEDYLKARAGGGR
jgi:hypothetical protein